MYLPCALSTFCTGVSYSMSCFAELGQSAGVEVGHETLDLVAFDLQDAHATVGDSVTVLGALGGPLQGGVTRVVGEDIVKLGLHLVEGLAVARPELPQSLVAPKCSGDRDVPDAAILRVDVDERLHVPVFFEFPQSLDELLRNLFGHWITTSYSCRFWDSVGLFPHGGCKYTYPVPVQRLLTLHGEACASSRRCRSSGRSSR